MKKLLILLLISSGAFAQIKIPNLPQVTSASPNDFTINQQASGAPGTTKIITWSNLFTSLGVPFGTSFWSLSGNSLAGTGILGSTNSQPVSFITGGSERLQLTANARAIWKVPFYDANTILLMSVGSRYLADSSGISNIDFRTASKVGIGTSTPGYGLDVQRDFNLQAGTNVYVRAPGANQLEMSATANDNITLNSGNAGILFASASNKAEMHTNYDYGLATDSNGTWADFAYNVSDYTWRSKIVGGVNQFMINHSGASGNRLGIGTSSPSEALHVVGSPRFVTGGQGSGKVLTSDANGVGSWTNPTSIFDSTHCFTKLKADTVQACSPLVLSSTGLKSTASMTVAGTFSTSTSVTTPTVSITSGSSSNLLSGSGTQISIGSGLSNSSGTLITSNIPNSALTNSTFTVNGTGMALGTSSTITAAAGTLTGTTLNSTVVSSSLTSVGTVTAGTWNATAIPIIYGGTNNTSTLTTYGQDYFNGTKITNGILNRYDSAQTVILNSPNTGSGRNEPSYNPPLLELVNNAANNNEGRQHLNFKTYGTTPGIINDIHFYRYGGTETSPTATPAGSISSFGWRGKGTTALSQSTAAFVVRALNLWTDSDEGTEIRFECNKTGTTWAGRRQIMTMGGYATNMSLTSDGAYSPYRTTGCLTIDMVTPNVSASTIPILIPHSTSFSGGMVMGSSVSDESYIFHYGSAVAGNLYGSVATGKTLRIMGNTGNAVVDGLSVGITPNSGTLGGITAMTSGVRIGTQANMGTAATGYLTVDGGTAALPSLVVGSQTSYTGTTDGSITNDATQKCFVKYVGSTKKYDVSAVYTQTAAITVASTTVATSVLTSTVSAGDLAAAKEIRIKLVGFHSAVSNPNITITVTLNGTTVLTTGAIASGNSTNAYAEINGLVTIRTTGVSGTVSGQGLYQEDGGGVANVYAPMVNTSTVTVNTTTPTIDVQAQWGTSSASNTITFTDGYIEIIK